MYNYIIVGSGPTGLTLAHILSQYGHKILILEKEDYIGGCHGVSRSNRLFAEHGPRIYLDNYYTFKQILKDLNVSWNDIFTKYNFNMSNIGGNILQHLSLKEIFPLFISFIFLNNSYKRITMKEFVVKHNFSTKAVSYIDGLCRLTDGMGIDRYSLYQFIQVINQNSLHTIYQPKNPNDILLFDIWHNHLRKNVDIMLNTNVHDIFYNNNKVEGLATNKGVVKGINFILAIPPSNILELFPIQRFAQWVDLTKYITYICVTFHWNKKINLKKVWGFKNTSWGLVFIVLSDYFENSKNKTIISAALTKDNMSNYIHKTPDQCNENELVNEMFRQLNLSFQNLTPPDHYVMNQNIYKNGKWISKHQSFVETKYGFIPNKTGFDNLYTCGVYNGHHFYSFTSLESAVSNAVSLCHQLEPHSKNKYKIIKFMTLRQLIMLVIIVFFILGSYVKKKLKQ